MADDALKKIQLQQIHKLCLNRSLTIAVAESITGGRLQAALTSTSGASRYFLGGVTAYNIDQKVNLLGVDREHAEVVNCVSEQVVKQMVTGVRKLFGADIGLATTGYAEAWPEGNVTRPFAFFAIGNAGNMMVERVAIENRSRIDAQKLIVDQVVKSLDEFLIEN